MSESHGCDRLNPCCSNDAPLGAMSVRLTGCFRQTVRGVVVLSDTHKPTANAPGNLSLSADSALAHQRTRSKATHHTTATTGGPTERSKPRHLDNKNSSPAMPAIT